MDESNGGDAENRRQKHLREVKAADNRDTWLIVLLHLHIQWSVGIVWSVICGLNSGQCTGAAHFYYLMYN